MNCRDALADLVYLHDLKNRLHALHEMGHGTEWDDYRRRKPIAWANARAALVGEEPRPINTAPFEKPLLLWWKHAGWMRGRFVVEDSGKAGWRCDGDQVMPRNQADCTHWLPLPPAIAARNP